MCGVSEVLVVFWKRKERDMFGRLGGWVLHGYVGGERRGVRLDARTSGGVIERLVAVGFRSAD